MQMKMAVWTELSIQSLYDRFTYFQEEKNIFDENESYSLFR